MFVCHKHFERKFTTEKSRLRFGAFPTLFTEDEFRSGVPSTTLEADIIRQLTFDHCYDRSRVHEDHTYSKIGPACDAITAPSLEQPPVPLQLPTTSGLPFNESRILREIQNLPQDSAMLGPTPGQPPVLEVVHKQPDQPAGSSLQPVPNLREQQALPITAPSGSSLQPVPSLREQQALPITAPSATYPDGRKVSDTLKNTSEAVSFLDKLFDSVNGASLSDKIARGKMLKKAVTDSSPHHEFWRDAIKKLENMKFIDENRREVSVPSIKNWIITFKSYIRLWQFFKKRNIIIMRPRYFNSDPIENFFGQVRAYNFRNNDPTCHTFISTFKSLLITRFIKFHSAGFNCEEDVGVQLINIKKLFQPAHYKEPDTTSAPHIPTVDGDQQDQQNIEALARRERISVHSRAYTAGWLVRKINQKLNCRECLADLTTTEGPIHSWISHREYNWLKNQRLTYPSEHAVRSFGDIIKESNKYLDRKPHLNSIKQKIKEYILSKYLFDFLQCEQHKSVILEYFLNLSIKFAVFNWCNTINKMKNKKK